jgi:hypothetical protein
VRCRLKHKFDKAIRFLIDREQEHYLVSLFIESTILRGCLIRPAAGGFKQAALTTVQAKVAHWLVNSW